MFSFFKICFLVSQIFVVDAAKFVTPVYTKEMVSRSYEYNSFALKTFMEFKEFFQKEYVNYEEYSNRLNIFKQNYEKIMFHNKNDSKTYSLGINQFSDLTLVEFSALVKSNMKSGATTKSTCKEYVATTTNETLPDEVDWREKGGVTPVKNQGQCGSCWSFSATGALEGALFQSTGKLISLSEQQLVDCSRENSGCNGGLMDNAFYYAMDNGLCAEEAYPYEATENKCVAKSCSPAIANYKSIKCFDIPENNQAALKAAVAQSPVSIAIEADKRIFQSYSSGVIKGSQCGTNLDHGVLIVGYGEDPKFGKYWLVKNSWDTTWGDEGYVKIERSDSDDDAGTCGIAMSASFPLL